ncbi:MAG: ornithine carbamoyltransferase [Micavibrio aeruginosavorus]|uniref:Ornithine carbamoyltransferase n=1 Tax=Micavibrio aeruginosavorus TaxID=349221 RepID=A0A2W5N1I1_9BACT|nr:MAG: ornithine carbamoyltransferase [Micavibrio aeruginosavorus]
MKHFLELSDIPAATLREILDNAHALKKDKYAPPQILEGLSLAMMFDKRSTRTRVSFEVAMKQLGGHTIVMGMNEMQIGGAESIEDTAKVLSRFVDAVMIRISDQDTLYELAKHAGVPVINGMTDYSHPCQIMADLMTIEEKLGSIKGKKIAWFGDYNNVARTFVQASKKFEFDFIVAIPPALQMKADMNAVSTADPAFAAKDADVLVTDTWVSMGQEGKDIEQFRPYQVNAKLMELAKPHAIFMHCMPIHQGEEVADEVLKSSASVIYDEAENRLHAQKAILAYCLKESGVRIKRAA